MSLDTEARLRAFLASAPQTLRIIPTLEISHPAMENYDDPGSGQAFYIWREPVAGEITTEHGVRTVLPVNFEVKLAGSESNLDQNFQINIDTVDIDDRLREQLDLIPLDTVERIRVVYREYLSDDLTDVQCTAILQVESMSFQAGAATMAAVSPRLNTLRTGELYTARDVPMLRGFL